MAIPANGTGEDEAEWGDKDRRGQMGNRRTRRRRRRKTGEQEGMKEEGLQGFWQEHG